MWFICWTQNSVFCFSLVRVYVCIVFSTENIFLIIYQLGNRGGSDRQSQQQQRPPSAASSRNREEQEYLEKLRQIRQQNYMERRNIQAKIASDKNTDAAEERKKKAEALKVWKLCSFSSSLSYQSLLQLDRLYISMWYQNRTFTCQLS